MSLINHDIVQVAQQPLELAMHWENALVQHVRVGDQELGPVPDLSTLTLQQGLHVQESIFKKALRKSLDSGSSGCLAGWQAMARHARDVRS